MAVPSALPLAGAVLEIDAREDAAVEAKGSPGIARSLWFAGKALDDAGYQDIAVAAMEAVYRRPLNARQIDSPTFCHGVAGLQQITLRFEHESGLPVFIKAARALHRLIDAYEPERVLGYRNLEPGGSRIDQPGLLDGSSGVALVLLAASTPVEPFWDALFLVSRSEEAGEPLDDDPNPKEKRKGGAAGAEPLSALRFLCAASTALAA